eukprot:5182362-Amphidinium_carterae.2
MSAKRVACGPLRGTCQTNAARSPSGYFSPTSLKREYRLVTSNGNGPLHVTKPDAPIEKN